MEIPSEERQRQLKHYRERHQAADAMIRGIYEKRLAWSAMPSAYEQKMRSAYATVKEDDFAAAAWQRLVNHLGHRTNLLSLEPALPAVGPQPGNTCLDALLMLALRHEVWQNAPETWEPTAFDSRQQIGELARHLLAHYYVPPFMDEAWFKGFSPQGEQYRDWFVHIGSGQNIRRAELPLHLTEKMAHHFLQAPDDSSLVGALRWAQIIGLGGDEFLALAVAEAKLGDILPDEPFWESVLHFFVNNPTMETSWVGPIIDFISAQKFGEEVILGPNGQPDFSNAPEPTFSMKGRKLVALQKRVTDWHEYLARESKRPKSAWEPCGIESFCVQERDAHKVENVWTIVELLNSKALQEEGREMKHCVFTYAPKCLNGTTAIFSLRARAVKEVRNRRLLTIEINLARRAIVQVRGRCNLAAGASRGGRMKTAGEILRRWAKQQKLSISCGL